MSEVSNTKNIKRLTTPIDYMFGSEDDVLDIDTTGGVANIYLPNIVQSGSLQVRKRIYINDVGANASVNNINIIGIDGDRVNDLAVLVLNVNSISAEILIANRTEYIANLSTSSGGGGGSITDFKKIILVDGVYGNDTTAVAYNQLLPFKTVDMATSVAVAGDLIYINPNIPLTPYIATSLIPSLAYYVSAGATLQIISLTICTFAGQGDIYVYGDGTLQLSATIFGIGDYDGRITLECQDIIFTGMEIVGYCSSSVYVRARGTLTLNSYFYLQTIRIGKQQPNQVIFK